MKFAVFAAIIATGPGSALAADKKPATTPPVPLQTWENKQEGPHRVELPELPDGAVFVQTGREGRPWRTLSPDTAEGKSYLWLPGGGTVQAWDRKELARTGPPMAGSAQWGAFPEILIGPFAEAPRESMSEPVRAIAPWKEAPTLFRAFPDGIIPVMVRVKNDGTGVWKNPRVRLMAPDDWTVTPETVPMTAADGTALTKGLLPTTTGSAMFNVIIPRNTPLQKSYPVTAFVRFEAPKKQEVTARNSVDVRVLEPVERRYGMDEDGRKLVVRLINKFRPINIGSPVVEVRLPGGADWGIVQPAIEPLQNDRDSVAVITKRLSPPDPLAIPVVVTLNGLRMGYTPTISASIAFGPTKGERGLRHQNAQGPGLTETADGLSLSPAGGSTELAFEVTDRFAVSDPKSWVSPTWVTVRLATAGQGRIRLEYDAFGAEGAVVAADVPLPVDISRPMVFLLPDARFAGGLTGKADLRLVVTGPCVVTEVRASKWNPARQ